MRSRAVDREILRLAVPALGTIAFALDSLAIAAQALIGRGLGAAALDDVAWILRRCLRWGVGAGVAIGIAVVATAWFTAPLFTSDAAVAALLPAGLVIAGVGAPVAGYVFVLDGVLIGAGDGRYLAATGALNTAVFVPLAIAVALWAPPGATGLALLTAAYSFGYLSARAVTLGARSHGTRWMRVGAA